MRVLSLAFAFAVVLRVLSQYAVGLLWVRSFLIAWLLGWELRLTSILGLAPLHLVPLFRTIKWHRNGP